MAGDASALMESLKEYLEPAAKVAVGVKGQVRGRWGPLARVWPMPADPSGRAFAAEGSVSFVYVQP